MTSACVAEGREGLAPTDWKLVELNGLPVTFDASLSLAEPGRLSGAAPCNRYFGALDRDADRFVPGPLATTKMACPALQDEATFLAILQSMTHAKTEAGHLTLTGGGHQMHWVQAAP